MPEIEPPDPTWEQALVFAQTARELHDGASDWRVPRAAAPEPVPTPPADADAAALAAPASAAAPAPAPDDRATAGADPLPDDPAPAAPIPSATREVPVSSVEVVELLRPGAEAHAAETRAAETRAAETRAAAAQSAQIIEAAGPPRETPVSPSPPRSADSPSPGTGIRPAAPPATDAIIRGLNSLTRATQECGKAVARLSKRVEGMEQRLDAIDAAAGTAGTVSNDDGRLQAIETRLAAVESVPAAVDQVQDRLSVIESLPAMIDEMQVRLAGVEALPAVIDEIQHDMAAVVTTQAGAPMDTALDEIRGDVVATSDQVQFLDHRMAGLEVRLTTATGATADADAATAEAPAAALAEEISPALLSLPQDIEGLYKELDGVAELVAARDAAILQSLNRIDSLEKAVRGLRDDLDRPGLGPRSGLAGPLPDGEAGQTAAVPVKVVQVLTAELDRIRQSLDVLASEEGRSGISRG